jgi:2-oxoglutarate ferredoxin oxidoreductase subunit alpha
MRERITVPEFIEVEVAEQVESFCDEPFGRDERLIPVALNFFEGHNVLVEGQLHDGRGRRVGHIAQKSGEFVEELVQKIRINMDKIVDVEHEFLEDADTVVIAYGTVARSAKRAVRIAREQGKKVGLIKINIVWPLPRFELQRLVTDKVKTIIIPEMNMGKYCIALERRLKHCNVVSLPKLGGTIHQPKELLNVIMDVGVQNEIINEGAQNE